MPIEVHNYQPTLFLNQFLFLLYLPFLCYHRFYFFFYFVFQPYFLSFLSFLSSVNYPDLLEVGASCFIHRGYYHIFRKLIKFLEAVFSRVHRLFQSVFLIPRSGCPIPTFVLFLFLHCFHLFIEDPNPLDQDIDRSVFITIMFCSTNRTDPGMNVQVLDFLILISTDIA